MYCERVVRRVGSGYARLDGRPFEQNFSRGEQTVGRQEQEREKIHSVRRRRGRPLDREYEFRDG